MMMNRFKMTFCVLLLSLFTMAPVLAADTAPEAVATELLDYMDAAEYGQAEAMFGPEMAEAVPAAKLQALWESLPEQAGDAIGRGEPVVQTADGKATVQIPLSYANAELLATIAIGADGKVIGFRMQPAPAPAAPPPPADADYEEHDISIGNGERALPGTLAMPKSNGPFPAVVLVHGSGPHDRDESIGPNRPFLDIARGLAAQGVAVLRYDKRTKARPQDYSADTLTIDSETTDDAVAAIATLADTPGIDPKRIFVLGHSQGGMMAPRIAAHAIDAGMPVAGLILMAAPSRKLLDILIEQTQRMAVLDDGHTSDEESAALNTLRAQVGAIRTEGGEVPADQTPLKLPASYWRTTDMVDPVAEAGTVALPMLVLQGARDIQVVDADWQGWKRGFHDDPEVGFVLYPTLNHLGIAGEGDGSLAEYDIPGNVDAQLIDDVGKWVQSH